MARADRPLVLSWISVEDAAQPRAGNRFDVLGGGVLYLGSTALGCYLETLARLRPTARMRALLADEDPEFMMCGAVPDWRYRRLQLSVTLPGSLPFFDVEDPCTHEYLTATMARPLATLDVPQLDVSDVRGRDRLLTRAIASWAYTARNDAGEPAYSGIRYVSRHGDHECWAVFNGTTVTETARTAIELTTVDFATAVDSFQLRAF